LYLVLPVQSALLPLDLCERDFVMLPAHRSDYPDDGRRAHAYTHREITRVDRDAAKLRRFVANDGRYDATGYTTIPAPGWTPAPLPPSQAATFLNVSLFPPLMDEDLKLRLSRHPLVEAVIIVLSVHMHSKREHRTIGAFTAFLGTLNLYYLGTTKPGHHRFNLDPMYQLKLDEKIQHDRNRERRARVDDLLNNGEDAGDDANQADGAYARRAMDETRGSQVQRRISMFATIEDEEAEAGSRPEETEDGAESWADAQDDDIQAFVDDRVILEVYMTNAHPFIVKAFKFTLGEPIRVK